MLADIGRDVLEHFPWMPGACAPMSAIFAARWQMNSDLPIYVGAGDLYIGDNRIFGTGQDSDELGAALSVSDASWDGHCWLLFGNYIADISVCRTAYSDYSPPLLAQHINTHLGPRRGLLISNGPGLAELSLHYHTRYVFTEDQVTNHVLGAKELVNRRLSQ